ncbi:MAG: amidohydrolase family protein [Phycisphaeraceae bacterium]
MGAMLIQNVRAMQPGEGIVASSVLIDGGRITALDPHDVAADVARFDGDGRLLTPGLIDVHIHGIEQHFFEQSPEALVAGVERLPRYGVTTVLPTLYTVMRRGALPRLEALGAALDRCRGSSAPGFHLEGPFLALPGAGAATLPGDLVLLEEILAAAGKVLAMSVSPDTPGILPLIQRLRERGITVFLTHTRASVEQTTAAIDAGARHATHFYDVFPLPQETDPGVRPVGAVETILADPRVTVDFIADGVHVHPMAIKAALAAKGRRGVILITDANVGAGLPAGTYDTTWGYRVKVSPSNAARIDLPGDPRDGGLAGSALTMNVGMSNLLRWLDLPAHDVWAIGSANTARMLGMSDRGELRVGASADLVLWDQGGTALSAVRTWVGGQCVHEQQTQERVCP